MRRTTVVLVVLALVLSGVGAVVLALSAGDGASDTPAADDLAAPPSAVSTAPDPGATRPPRPALAEFYSQTLDWSACGAYLCATLSVPLDYRHPDAETIGLAVLKVPAADPDRRIGSMVVNPGGPGAPGTQYAAQAGQVFRQPLLDRFDVVGFDPRGTGSSDPVDCLTDQEMDDYVAIDPSPDTPAEEQTYQGWVDRLGRGCVAHSGELAAHVSTIEAARDIDVLRAALGEQQLTYFGASYGTKLGATYADLFPERVGRLVLDGAVDLSISSRQLALQQAAGFQTALRSYVGACVERSDCFLGDSVEAGLSRISDFLDSVDEKPLPTSSGRDLTVGNAFYGIVLPLYNRDYWSILDAALQQGFAGNGDALLQLSDLYVSRGPSGYTDNSAEAIYAISCLDDPYAITADQVPGQLADFERASPTFGDVFAWGLTNCGGVRVQSTEEPREVHAEGAAPILVIGTTRDPATPMQWAVDLADQLDSGVLVRRDGDGHTGYNAGNQCVDSAVEDYLIDGTVPRDGLSC